MSPFSALVVDDDADFRESLSLLVEREGFEVRQAASVEEARLRLAEAPADVVLADLGLPDGSGVDLLRDEDSTSRGELVVVTGNATVESAIQALRDGALDYLTKPVDRSRLKSTLAGVRRTREFRAEVRGLQGELRQLGRFGRLVGRSESMQQVYDLIARVAPTRASVLLSGESGTGKELAAETIHKLSRRSEGPFLAVNCGAIAKSLIESELFGHEKGSFTGADRSRRGYFEEANGGTLFLDELSDMPPTLQGKLLRALETSTIVRVGGTAALPVDVRVVAATNRDPAELVREGALRPDLYYRLNVFPIALPPLRGRTGDVELLADHFLEAVNARDESQKRWSAAARAALEAYPWPGNVRELKNAVERAAILAEVTIGPELLPGEPVLVATESQGDGSSLQVPVGSTLEETERRLILATLEKVGGDKKSAAQALQISLKTLYTRLSVYRAQGHVPDNGTSRGRTGSKPAAGSGIVENAAPIPPETSGSDTEPPPKSLSDR